MSFFKCKMCGGNIIFSPGDTVGTCDSCGSFQTVSTTDDDIIKNLFERANNLRMHSEFDEAARVYEKILDEDNSDSEAHWGLVLCKYGVEYIKDPNTSEYVPACHRAQYESILTDVDYIAAIENSDPARRKVLSENALRISEIQKEILSVTGEDNSFDVFICCKETDDNGKRTVDSAIAADLYYELTQEGFKVFYAAITLEDRLGREFEPYIFSALQSAKVMLALGTKPEYFRSVWVRNEWSRFLKLMKSDRSRLLIPCYRDMDAYDLPEEFAHLQAQDMGKIGFAGDIVRGIKKVIGSEEDGTAKASAAAAAPEPAVSVASLLKRAFLFLEDGKWAEANRYCERVLDREPENARAYLGKLMAELHINTADGLKNAAQPFDGNGNAVKAARFDSALAEKFKADNAFIRERNETARKQSIYDEALKKMRGAKSEAQFKSAAYDFKAIPSFKDAGEKAGECLEKAEEIRKDGIYGEAESNMGKTVQGNQKAIELFESIIDWKDSRTRIDECLAGINDIKIAEEKAAAERRRKAEEARMAAEKRKALIKRYLMIIVPVAAAAAVFLIILNTVIAPAGNYKKAVAAAEAGDYAKAYSLFANYPYYRDTPERVANTKLKQATELLDAGKYRPAYKILEEIGSKDAITENMYSRAEKYLEAKEYQKAYALLNRLGDTEKINESMYSRAAEFEQAGDTEAAYAIFTQIEDYKDSKARTEDILKVRPGLKYKPANAGDTVTIGRYQTGISGEKEDMEWLVLAKEKNRILVISKNAVDCRPYNTADVPVTWADCSLRKWLNDSFYPTVFNETEQSIIPAVTVTADANPAYSTDPGSDVTDKMFLLSTGEANKYFSSDKERVCVPTAYAEEQGAAANTVVSKNGKSACLWWLRSPGCDSYNAACVYEGGAIGNGGYHVDSARGCVRPAMWIEF